MIDVTKCEYYHDNMLHIKGYCSCNFIKQCQCKEITDCVFKLKYLVRKLDAIKEQLKNVDFTQCSRCDGCGYYEGCADTDCSTYILYKISEIMEQV